jgi:CubicO group peptidase (beta-lactamase class C family)
MLVKLIHSIFLSCLLAACATPEEKTTPNGLVENSIDRAGAKNYWKASTPSAEGVNPLVIDSIDQEIKQGIYGYVDHFLLIRNGKLIVDQHYNQDYRSVMEKYDTTNHQYNYDHTAWHPYYKNTALHTLQSVTKSVTSILLGIALDEGFISGVDSSVWSFFMDYELDLSDERKRSLTIHALLTMQTGIEWDEENYNEADNSCILMEGSEDWIQFVLNHPMDAFPGSVFEYNSGASVLLGKIVRTATGKRIDEWAEEKLFSPLGITNYYWKLTPKGEVDTEGGLYLSAHDLAKIGYLMLHKGKWENQQIVSKQWVEKSVKPFVTFSEQSGYGYQWWVPKYAEDKAEIFAGNGYGGQFLLVVPEYDMIVVFNGWNIHEQTEKSTWRALQDRILPATRL